MLGCWFGNLTTTYQEHPSPLICLLPASSFFSLSRIDFFFICGTFQIDPGRGPTLDSLLSGYCGLSGLHPCNTVEVLFASTTIPHVLQEERGWLSSLSVSTVLKTTQKREISEGITFGIGGLFPKRSAFPSARKCYKEICEMCHLFLKLRITYTVLCIFRALSILAVAKLYAFS